MFFERYRLTAQLHKQQFQSFRLKFRQHHSIQIPGISIIHHMAHSFSNINISQSCAVVMISVHV